LRFEKVHFLSELPLELLNQEDQMMKRNTSGVMEHSLTLQGAMSHALGRNGGGSGMGRGRVLGGGAGGRHSDKGEGCNTLYYGYANHLH
jgi:hypothetical protein